MTDVSTGTATDIPEFPMPRQQEVADFVAGVVDVVSVWPP